jgi:subtilase family serine protease
MAIGVEMVYVKRAVSWRLGAGSGDGPPAMDAGRDSCTGSAQMQCDGTGSGEGPGTALEAARTCRNLQCDDTGSGEGPGTALEAARTCRIQ